MFVKQEHPLNVNPEAKLNNENSKNEDSDETETPDNKPEEIKTVNTE